MENEELNVFTGKSYEEALNNALLSMPGLTKEDVDVTVLEEGKKKLFGSTKWKIKVTEKQNDGARAAQFVEGILGILGVEAHCDISADEGNIKIDVKTETGARVIGKRGEILDALQCLAGAAANIGREEYVKVVVDCENYRTQREETLQSLAHKVEKKAVETGRKVILEPMNPYERRIIHAALVSSTEVKTSSEGKEPARYVVVIPNNARPGDRGIRYGERRDRNERSDRNGRDRDRGGRRERFGRGRPDGERRERPARGAKRGKKEIYFGTFLGNSGAGKKEDEEDRPQNIEE